MGEVRSENQKVLDDFLLHLTIANKSQNTLKNYTRILKHFLNDMPVLIEEITSDHIYKWLKNRGEYRSEATISTWLSILSSFFTFCLMEDYIEQTPIKERWRPRLPKPTPKYVEKGELAKVRIQAESEILRDQVLFEFLVSSGCRITETLMLNKEDINMEERTARVTGKGNKIRTVHFSSRCAILLEKLLKTLPQKSEAIFLNRHGNRLARGSAHKIFSAMGKSLKLKGPLGPHRLRHTFATTLLSKGADLSFISEELGHSQLSTTRVYARLPKEKIVSMYRKYMG